MNTPQWPGPVSSHNDAATDAGTGREMDRRRFVALMGGALAVPLEAVAQLANRKLRVAILDDGSEEGTRQLWQAFLRRLEQLGYAQGKNLMVEARYARGATEQLAALAAELVMLKPDVIVSSSTSPARAARQATSSIPIVFIESADPVGAGLVASLGRPEGNATGLSPMQAEMAGKWIELLREFAPGAKRLAFLADSSNKGSLAILGQLQEQGRSLGSTFRMLDGRQRAGLERSFDIVVRERIEGLIVGGTPVLLDHREEILQFWRAESFPPFTFGGSMWRRADFFFMGRIASQCTCKRRTTFTGSLKGRSPRICRWNGQLQSEWWST